MGNTILPSLELWNGAELPLQFILQIVGMEALQKAPDAAVRAIERPGDPRMVCGRGLADNVESRVGMRLHKMGIETAKLAGGESSNSARGKIIGSPVEACVVSAVVYLKSATSSGVEALRATLTMMCDVGIFKHTMNLLKILVMRVEAG